jgi:hypothetical protein
MALSAFRGTRRVAV